MLFVLCVLCLVLLMVCYCYIHTAFLDFSVVYICLVFIAV